MAGVVRMKSLLISIEEDGDSRLTWRALNSVSLCRSG